MSDPLRSARLINVRDYAPAKPNGPRLPHNAVRITRPTVYGNPFKIGGMVTRVDVIEAYRNWLAHRLAENPSFLEPLRGKVLACYCYPLPCHGDVILEALDGMTRRAPQ